MDKSEHEIVRSKRLGAFFKLKPEIKMTKSTGFPVDVLINQLAEPQSI